MSSSSVIPPPPPFLVAPLIDAALREDLGHGGDLTSRLIFPEDRRLRVRLCARGPGRLAGLGVALSAFRRLDPDLVVASSLGEGDAFQAGACIAEIEGGLHAILAAERVALNLLGRLSGVAAAAAAMCEAVKPWKARICCTRKTTPGLRLLEKYAVAVGGGVNHRFGLGDGVLIKDNHIAAAGGVAAALAALRGRLGPMMRVEIEIEKLDDIRVALEGGVDVILLDNMSPERLAQAVAMIDRRALVEASGGMTPQTAPAAAEAGVDFISSGWMTMSAAAVDVALDFQATL